VDIAVLHGPNLDLLGVREPGRYGTATLADIGRRLARRAAALRVRLLPPFQSNHEGALVEAVHALRGRADGALVNAAAYTHTSVALRDALLAVGVPFVEVHLSNVWSREPFRHQSLLSDIAVGVVAGFGAASYELGLEALVGHLKGDKGTGARGDRGAGTRRGAAARPPVRPRRG
jgi:3-dehydroquinate dehydratase-2